MLVINVIDNKNWQHVQILEMAIEITKHDELKILYYPKHPRHTQGYQEKNWIWFLMNGLWQKRKLIFLGWELYLAPCELESLWFFRVCLLYESL